MEQMERIRDQQENLAKLHFELGAKQDVLKPLSEEGLRTANDNMDKLMGRLEVCLLAKIKFSPTYRFFFSSGVVGCHRSAQSCRCLHARRGISHHRRSHSRSVSDRSAPNSRGQWR